MKKNLIWLSAILLVAALSLTGCGSNNNDGADVQGNDVSGGGYPEPPAPYASMTNPVDGDESAIQAGESTYQTNCASCHGPQGAGDGPAAGSLNPPPSHLAENEEDMSDAYLYWRIAEGGAMDPFNSTMPAWKGILSEDQIWQVVSYIRVFGE